MSQGIVFEMPKFVVCVVGVFFVCLWVFFGHLHSRFNDTLSAAVRGVTAASAGCSCSRDAHELGLWCQRTAGAAQPGGGQLPGNLLRAGIALLEANRQELS